MAPVKKAGRGSLTVVYLPTKELKPHPKNVNVHPPEQIDKIARSIEAFGWTKPIILNPKRFILAGHGAWQAAQQLGMDTVPTITRAGLTVAQERAYLIADNQIPKGAHHDEGLLAGELAALQTMGFDLSLTGFSQTEVEFMLAPSSPDPVEPPVPAIQKRAVSRLGDVWQMGEHRLICGDSTQPATYKALMQRDARPRWCSPTHPTASATPPRAGSSR